MSTSTPNTFSTVANRGAKLGCFAMIGIVGGFSLLAFIERLLNAGGWLIEAATGGDHHPGEAEGTLLLFLLPFFLLAGAVVGVKFALRSKAAQDVDEIARTEDKDVRF